MCNKEIVLTLPPGDQVDLESEFTDFMLAKARKDPNFPLENAWGESSVKQGNKIHTIQWSYIGIGMIIEGEPAVYDEDYTAETLDFQVDCSWLESDGSENG